MSMNVNECLFVKTTSAKKINEHEHHKIIREGPGQVQGQQLEQEQQHQLQQGQQKEVQKETHPANTFVGDCIVWIQHYEYHCNHYKPTKICPSNIYH
jgi:hypothetical protein